MPVIIQDMQVDLQPDPLPTGAPPTPEPIGDTQGEWLRQLAWMQEQLQERAERLRCD